MKEYMSVLGLKVKDKVTGFTGAVSSVSFDLYGCVQVVITPPANEKGELVDGRWFDFNRVTVLNRTPVMAAPSFASEFEKGPAEKPAFMK